MRTEEAHIKANIWLMTCVCLHNLILTLDGKSDAMLNDPNLIPASGSSRASRRTGRVEPDSSNAENVRAGERLRQSIALHLQTLQDAMYEI